mmetsp:Transcript_45855/g.74820  ORF Transcript_45855/g.74820 Transcript_45855/m.74820 type:complete len:328 (-) Transcript_45855:478-1461(-)
MQGHDPMNARTRPVHRTFDDGSSLPPAYQSPYAPTSGSFGAGPAPPYANAPYGGVPPSYGAPQQPPPGGFAPQGANAGLAFLNDAALARVGFDVGQRFIGSGKEMVQQNLSRYGFTLEGLRYYFNVNNSYVVNKLKILLFPYNHRTWSRLLNSQMDGSPGEYKSPRNDVNAPDLYIPVMAFVTYILAVGYALGTENRFKPQVLGITASSGIGLLLFELLFTKLGFYLLNGPAISFLDFLAYTGYKYVSINAIITARLLLPSFGYWLMLGWASVAMAIFLMRTFTRILNPPGSVNAVDTLDQERQRRSYFLLAVAIMQLPLCWLASRV